MKTRFLLIGALAVTISAFFVTQAQCQYDYSNMPGENDEEYILPQDNEDMDLPTVTLTDAENNAKANIMLIADAIEKYAEKNEVYPNAEDDLLSSTPPYLSRPYDGEEIDGYKYSLELDSMHYKISALPIDCGNTGSKIFELNTGGAIIESNCQEETR